MLCDTIFPTAKQFNNQHSVFYIKHGYHFCYPSKANFPLNHKAETPSRDAKKKKKPVALQSYANIALSPWRKKKPPRQIKEKELKKNAPS